jgi:ssDNA-binding Zn-finger/Zn-ribbon topoisomerase 1
MSSLGTSQDGQVVSERAKIETVDELASKATPHCPLCDASMVLRTAREGRHAGRGFWGCSRRKECKGIRALA